MSSPPENKKAPGGEPDAEKTPVTEKRFVNQPADVANSQPGSRAINDACGDPREPREMRPQDGKGKPWYIWQDCRAVNRIIDKLGGDAGNGLAVYLVLTKIAGEFTEDGKIKGPRFREGINRIRGFLGWCYNTTHATLHKLESEAGVITIQPVKSKTRDGQGRKVSDKSIYTLVSFCIPPTSKNGVGDVKRRGHVFAENKTDNPEGVYQNKIIAPDAVPLAPCGARGAGETKERTWWSGTTKNEQTV